MQPLPAPRLGPTRHLLHADAWFYVHPEWELVEYTAEREVKVKNLVVSASPEYLIYDPDAENPDNTISYTLDDTPAEDPLDNETTVYLDIFTSDQTQIRHESFVKYAPCSDTYVWDGKDGSGNLMPKGIYIYEVVAVQFHQQLDFDCEKSWWELTSTSEQTVGRNESTGAAIMRIGYHIATEGWCDAQTATGAEVKVFDPDLQVVGGTSVGSPPTNQDNFFPDFDLLLTHPTGGKYTFLVSAWDNHPAHDRNHRDRTNPDHPGVRPLLQNNRRKELKRIMAFLDAGHGGTDSGTPGTDRYPEWAEREANEWVRGDLQNELTTHGHEENSCGIGSTECLWKRYNVKLVPRYLNAGKENGRERRAKWVDEVFDKSKPRYALFVSLHCNAPSATSRRTEAWYRPDITDSQSMAEALIQNLENIDDNYDPPLQRSYSTNNATGNRRMSMLAALADKEHRLHTYKAPSDLLEMVMLTQPDDEDLINTEFGRGLFASFIHTTYCHYDLPEIVYRKQQ